MTKLNVVLGFAILSGCADQPGDGLVIETQGTDRLAGRYTQSDVELAFDFARVDGVHTLAFADADGRPLITTTIDGAIQTTNVLDGKLVYSGVVNAPDPQVVGDRDALSELHGLPEASLLVGLRAAFVERGIDLDLVEPSPKVPSVEDAGNGYFKFHPGESREFISAAGPSPTYIFGKRINWNWCDGEITMVSRVWGWRATLGIHEVGNPNQLALAWWGDLFRVYAPSTGWWLKNNTYFCGQDLLVKVSPYYWSP